VLDAATQTYTPTWGVWAASGGKTPFFQITGSSTDPNYNGDALSVDASSGVAIGSVTVSGGIAGPTQNIVVIGNQAVAASAANEAVVIGQKASAAQYASDTVIIGSQASVGNYGQYSVAIGEKASSNKANSVAIGYESTVTQTNEFSVGNSTQQRTITNVALGVNPTDAANMSQLAGAGVPISTLALFAGFAVGESPSAPPPGWLLTDGSPVDRTTYANLFAVIGTAFGAGDGSTTFNLPNVGVGMGNSSVGAFTYCIKY
jgi:hypothetical protein